MTTLTTANTPWTAEYVEHSSIHSGEQKYTFIKDQAGNIVGQFSDWRDAELVIESVNEGKRVAELESEILDLKSEIEGLEKIDVEREELITNLEKENEQLQDKLEKLEGKK